MHSLQFSSQPKSSQRQGSSLLQRFSSLECSSAECCGVHFPTRCVPDRRITSLKRELLKGIFERGYEKPSPIQAARMPLRTARTCVRVHEHLQLNS